MVMNIPCKTEKFTYNTLASIGVMKTSPITVAAVVYSCVIHSIHRMLSRGYNITEDIKLLNVHSI